MQLDIKGLGIKAIAKNENDSNIIRALVETERILDFKKTPRGTQVTCIFDPIPYIREDDTCFLHKDYFFDISGGVKFNVSKEVIKEYPVKLNFNKSLKARDYQIPVIEKLVAIKPDQVVGLTLATGRGKTYSACRAVYELGLKTFIYIKAEYCEKWVADIKFYFNLKEDEYYLVQGRDALDKLLNSKPGALKGIKIYIVAMQTFNVYTKNFLLGKGDYKIPPTKFLEHIQCSLMLVDEGHEAFENVYRVFPILCPSRTFILSATLYNIDARVETFMKDFIKEPLRVTDGFVNKHATCIGVRYSLNNPKSIHCRTFMGYSHILFEKSLRKRTAYLTSFFGMYKVFLDMYYMKEYKKGDKAVLFFSTREMCNLFIEYIKNEYPEKNCTVYVQGYTFETVIANDIVATTIGKMGAAVDVPDLTCVLQTVVVSSRTKNEQTLGRLRPIPGRGLYYIYFNAINIESHTRNADMRKRILGNVSDELITMKYNKFVG